MKKLLVILLLVVLSIGLAFAQGVYGLKAGLNISNFSGDDADDLDTKSVIGFNGGLFMQKHIHPMIILQPELNYSHRGAMMEINLFGTEIELRDNLHYLELPLFVKLDLGEGNLKFQPYLGPELRYLIKGNGTTEADGDETTEELEDTNDFDYGVGLGIDLLFNMKYMAGFRYSQGLAEVFENDVDTRNSSIMFNLGILY